jgi:hypothetical protein
MRPPPSAPASPRSRASRVSRNSSRKSNAPAPAARRAWRDLPGENDASWKDVLRKATDPTSGWSVAAAGGGTFVLSCAILLYMRPKLLMKKAVDGQPPRLSLPKLLAAAASLSVLVALLCFFLVYRAQNA